MENNPSPRPAPFPVGVMGAPMNTGNRGVSALGASLVKLIVQARPSAAVSFLIGNRDAKPSRVVVDGQPRMIPVVNFRASPRAHPRDQLAVIMLATVLYRLLPFRLVRRALGRGVPWVRAVEEAVIVGDIRGGDSFSDIYGLRRFFVASLPVISVIWIKGSVVLFPQTYGPFKSVWARRLAGYILNRASTILCRDRVSVEEVGRLTGGRREGCFCPDVAFALEPWQPESPDIQPPLPAGGGEVLVGLNVNGLMYNGGYTRDNMFGLKLDYREFLARLAAAVLAVPGTRLLLVPHTFAPDHSVESDPGASRELFHRLPPALRDRVHLVAREYDQHEIKGVIGRCDFFVGSRMHSCIAALSQGIPTVGVAYSRKFVGVFESVGAADWIVDGRTEEAGAAVDRIVSLLHRREQIRPTLLSRVESARNELSSIFEAVFSGRKVVSRPAATPRPGHGRGEAPARERQERQSSEA